MRPSPSDIPKSEQKCSACGGMEHNVRKCHKNNFEDHILLMIHAIHVVLVIHDSKTIYM